VDNGADTAVPQEGAPSPGPILAAERERQGLSRADIAQRLHMSVAQVEALEVGDYERLPRGPFLRGFARNYARALGLDAGAIVGLLATNAPLEIAPRIVVPTQNIRFDPLGARLSSPYVKAAGIAAVAIVLGFAGMYWWLFVRAQPQAAAPARKPAASAPATPAPVPAEPVAAAVPDSSPVPPPSTLSSPGVSLSAPPPAAMPAPAEPMAPHPEPAPIRQAAKTGNALPPTPAVAPAPPPAAAKPAAPAAVASPISAPATAPAPRMFDPPADAEGGGVIRMKFRASAWVEVKDARGKVLLSRNQPGGSDAEVAGKPPLSVVIGNAADVRLTYNDREVDLEPHTRVSVARLTLP
jgi:cytoskeleton protein RodZ